MERNAIVLPISQCTEETSRNANKGCICDAIWCAIKRSFLSQTDRCVCAVRWCYIDCQFFAALPIFWWQTNKRVWIVCEHRHTITVDDVGMMTDFVVLCTCSSLWISLVCSSLRFSFTKTETVRKTAFLFHRWRFFRSMIDAFCA